METSAEAVEGRNIEIFDRAAKAADGAPFESAEWRAFHSARDNADDTAREMGFEYLSADWYQYFAWGYESGMEDYR